MTMMGDAMPAGAVCAGSLTRDAIGPPVNPLCVAGPGDVDALTIFADQVRTPSAPHNLAFVRIDDAKHADERLRALEGAGTPPHGPAPTPRRRG